MSLKPNKEKCKAKIHCPVSGCLYFEGSQRFFTHKKLLNQHIAKVHAEKKYSCGKCQKGFGLDWWRKYHEKTCGTEWKCECGGKYSSWESLLTHTKRRLHKLPAKYLSSTKMKQNETPTAPGNKPVIILIQPIIQNWTCIQPEANYAASVQNLTSKTTPVPRPILPKITQPPLVSIPLSLSPVKSVCNPVYPSSVACEEPKEVLLFPALSQGGEVAPSPGLHSSAAAVAVRAQSTTSTQTEDCSAPKSRESRGSQCVRRRRKPKTTPVGIESTHTQTAESAVTKIKRRRSRRKSVAITTEPVAEQPSVWSDLKDLILFGGDAPFGRSVKSTTSTQTGGGGRVLCDSQTLTDDDLFAALDAALDAKDAQDCCSSFPMLPAVAAAAGEDPLMGITSNMTGSNLPILEMFGDGNPIAGAGVLSEVASTPAVRSGMASSTAGDNFNEVFSMFGESGLSTKGAANLSDIHTQTNGSAILDDYGLLANMETQTTDDFSLYDLEFSDTETQTPWEDFPSIDDSPVPANQLSIEIQTDFSSGINQDPYGFNSGFTFPGMMNGYKETSGVSTETQTYDKLIFPQLTNSESQTLDLFFS